MDSSSDGESGELAKFLDGRRERDQFECLRTLNIDIETIAKVVSNNRKDALELADRKEVLYNMAYKRVIERYGWYGPDARPMYPVFRIHSSQTINVRYDLKIGVKNICGDDLWLKDFLINIELLGLVHEFKQDPNNFPKKIEGEISECANKTF